MNAQSDIFLDSSIIGEIPYFDQYLGLWCIEPQAMRDLFSVAEKTNLLQHLRSDHVSQIKSQAPSGRSYRTDNQGVSIVSLVGPLQKHASSLSGGTSTVVARRDIRSAASDPDISAIMLHIESPGGTFAGNQELADEIERAKQQKPVLGFINDLGASAAYWLAGVCTEVLANRTALVGSIGTYAVISDYSAAAAQKGVKVHVVRAGEMKGAGSEGTEITPEQLTETQRHVESRNQFFLEAVAKGRNFSVQHVKDQLADGRLHTASEAVGLRLIDSIATFDEAFEKALSFSKRSTFKGARMSEKQIVTPKAIRAACKGVSAEFIVACVDQEFDMAETQAAWTAELVAQVSALSEQNKALSESFTKQDAEVMRLTALNEQLSAENAQLKEAAPLLGKIGVAPITELKASGKSSSANPQEAYFAAVSEQMEAGKTRGEAMKHVNKHNPELRIAMHGFVTN